VVRRGCFAGRVSDRAVSPRSAAYRYIATRPPRLIPRGRIAHVRERRAARGERRGTRVAYACCSHPRMRARARAHVHAPAPEESMQREREPNVGQTHTPFIRGAPGAFTVARARARRQVKAIRDVIFQPVPRYGIAACFAIQIFKYEIKATLLAGLAAGLPSGVRTSTTRRCDFIRMIYSKAPPLLIGALPKRTTFLRCSSAASG